MLTIAIALAGYAVYFTVNWKLLQQKGQTIGKKVMGIRIANLDGSKPNLKSLLLKRYLPLASLPYIPYAGMALMYADTFWIFGKRRRCLHDIIAGTQVVRA